MLEDFLPVWSKLTDGQRGRILDSLVSRSVRKGTILHNGSADCAGLLLVRSGQLRAYILSEEGREITIYRLFDRDLCLFSASCIIRSIQFDITVEAEKDTGLWVIPAETGWPSPMRSLPTTGAPTGRWSPGCSAIFKARGWSGCPGARSRSRIGKS